jgi:hypothetical protein
MDNTNTTDATLTSQDRKAIRRLAATFRQAVDNDWYSSSEAARHIWTDLFYFAGKGLTHCAQCLEYATALLLSK